MFDLRARQFIKNVLRCLRRLLVGEQQLLAPAEKFPKHRLSMLCGATAGISFIPGCDRCRPGCGWNSRWRSLRVLKPKRSRRSRVGWRPRHDQQ